MADSRNRIYRARGELMEIKAYLRILFKRWWILVLCLAVTLSASVILTLSQQKIYAATSVFLVRPRTNPEIKDEFVKVLDIVSRQAEINNTFAEVANSKQIKQSAIAKLGLSSQKRKGLSVGANVVGGTNIIEISVQGPDPEVVQDFANMVGRETVNYVQSNYAIFEMEMLDEADLPKSPAKPNVTLNLIMGAFLGFALGTGLIFLLVYIQSPSSDTSFLNIIERETGAYTKQYFILRLRQEMSRAKRNNYPLSLGLLQIDFDKKKKTIQPEAQIEAMSLVKMYADHSLREEDILARYESDVFALLLLDQSREKAKALIDKIAAKINTSSLDVIWGDDDLTITLASGVSSYDDYRITEEQFIKQALDDLKYAVPDTEEEEFIASQAKIYQNGTEQSSDDQFMNLESFRSLETRAEHPNGFRKHSPKKPHRFFGKISKGVRPSKDQFRKELIDE